jgi:hypothetical protein
MHKITESAEQSHEKLDFGTILKSKLVKTYVAMPFVQAIITSVSS